MELKNYPGGSKEQAKRLIQLLNENNACDSSIRNQIYKIFSIEGNDYEL